MNNYKEFKVFLENLKEKPKLLLHSCCGPCSTAVLERLCNYFDIDIYYYNPNIYPADEYVKRLNEQEKLLKKLNINLIKGTYNYDDFLKIATGLENEKEGGSRCYKCINMRMEKSAIYAKEKGYDYFTTTLSVSSHKNSKMINEIGKKLEEKYNIPFLYSDFKKEDGYKRSIELSRKYDLYRQNYCGCQYSVNKDKNINI